jgi:hypothetical protein
MVVSIGSAAHFGTSAACRVGSADQIFDFAGECRAMVARSAAVQNMGM